MSNSRSQPNADVLDTPVTASGNQATAKPKIPENEREKKERDSNRQLPSHEPDFFDSTGACHHNYWSDCIAQIAVDIGERQKNSSPCEYDFLKPKLVEYIFTVCVRLRLPNEVRFTAALILNTYLIRQLCYLREFMQKQDMSPQRKHREWDNLEATLERQIPLRILTAIQISTKIHSYHDSLSSRQVVNTLRIIGEPYTINAVLESEERVFRQIGHSIPDSPLEACEMAVKILTHMLNKRKMEEAHRHDDLWQHVLIVLDVCFIHHIELYQRFLRKCPHISNDQNDIRKTISQIKCDILLLASAIVQTAFILCIGKKHLSDVAKILNKFLRCVPDYVEQLRLSIIELATSKKSVEFSGCNDS